MKMNGLWRAKLKRYIRCIGWKQDGVLEYAEELRGIPENKEVKVLFVENESTYYIEVIR